MRWLHNNPLAVMVIVIASVILLATVISYWILN